MVGAAAVFNVKTTTTACQGDISYLLDDDFDDILKQLEKDEILDIELEDISTNVSILKLSALNIRGKTTTKVKPAIIAILTSPLSSPYFLDLICRYFISW